MISRPVTYPINLRQGSAPRSPGTHLSGVLRVIAHKTGIFKADEEDGGLDGLIDRTLPESVGVNGILMRLILGFMWEDWITLRIEGMVPHPGEFSFDGIYGNPDGIGFNSDGEIILHECKATFKSSKRSVAETLMWIWQGAGYLRMISEKYQEECRRVVYHPLYIKGDYRGIDPQYLPVEVEFEWKEIEGIWAMILEHKDLAKEETGV